MKGALLFLGLFGATAALGALLAGPPSEQPRSQRAGASPLPQRGAGRSQFEGRCLICHEETLIAQQRLTADQWKATVTKMEQKIGAPLEAGSDEERAVVEYLTSSLTKDTAEVTPVARPLPGPPPAWSSLVAPIAGADPAKGEPSYAKLCADCHGAKGEGVKAPRLVGRPALADAEAFARLIRDGRRGMPRNEAVSEEASKEILAWLRKLTSDEAPR